MFGYIIILWIIIPYNVGWFLLLCILHVVVLAIGGKMVKITEGPNPQKIQSLFKVIPFTCLMNVSGTIVSVFLMGFISILIPFFEGVHSEWGITNIYELIVAIIYSFHVIAIYSVVYSLSYFSFKKHVIHEKKRHTLFTASLVSSALLFEGINMWLLLSMSPLYTW